MAEAARAGQVVDRHAVIPVGGAITAGRPPAARHVRLEPVMGTTVRIEIVGADPHAEAVDDAVAWFHEVDGRFSPYRADSEMCRFARGELDEGAVHADILEVLRRCEAVRVWSGGAFDIRGHRADGLADPTGLVKGWSVDRAGAILAAAGARDWSIDAGGDVLTRGRSATGESWRVGIQHPRRRDAIAGVIVAADLAVATSGAYERGAHIVDARDGSSAPRWLSVTVVGPTLALADAYATAAFAMGAEAATWLSRLPDYEGCLISPDDRMLWTTGMDRYRDSP